MSFLRSKRNSSANRMVPERAVSWALLGFLLLMMSGVTPTLLAQSKRRGRVNARFHHHLEVKRHTSRAKQDEGANKGQQPKPASVTLAGGQLTVTAENSDLAQILDRISKLSGMQVSGQDSRAHVFGVYGPGTPQKVLSKLLAGSGYNFMMVGRTAVGAPRQLLLMAKSDAPEPTRPAMPSNSSQQSVAKGGGNPQQGNQSDSGATSEYQEPLGPGAIAHVPPSEQQANQEDPQTRLQQHLQQLEQQHQAQSQQQQQPQP